MIRLKVIEYKWTGFIPWIQWFYWPLDFLNVTKMLLTFIFPTQTLLQVCFSAFLTNFSDLSSLFLSNVCNFLTQSFTKLAKLYTYNHWYDLCHLNNLSFHSSYHLFSLLDALLHLSLKARNPLETSVPCLMTRTSEEMLRAPGSPSMGWPSKFQLTRCQCVYVSSYPT